MRLAEKLDWKGLKVIFEMHLCYHMLYVAHCSLSLLYADLETGTVIYATASPTLTTDC
jgi:hypothetical protein